MCVYTYIQDNLSCMCISVQLNQDQLKDVWVNQITLNDHKWLEHWNSYQIKCNKFISTGCLIYKSSCTTFLKYIMFLGIIM